MRVLLSPDQVYIALREYVISRRLAPPPKEGEAYPEEGFQFQITMAGFAIETEKKPSAPEQPELQPASPAASPRKFNS